MFTCSLSKQYLQIYSCETSLPQVYYSGLSKLLWENPHLYLLMYLDHYWSAHLWSKTHQYFLDLSGGGPCTALLHCPVVLLYAVIIWAVNIVEFLQVAQPVIEYVNI